MNRAIKPQRFFPVSLSVVSGICRMISNACYWIATRILRTKPVSNTHWPTSHTEQTSPRLTLVKPTQAQVASADRRRMDVNIHRRKIQEIMDLAHQRELSHDELVREITGILNLPGPLESFEMLSPHQIDIVLNHVSNRSRNIRPRKLEAAVG